MKILWIVSRPFPEAIQLLFNKKIEKVGSGGWQIALFNLLSKNKEVDLCIASPYNVSDVLYYKSNNVTYCLLPDFPEKCIIDNQSAYWKKIKKDFSPDVIHIHGTEYLYGLSYLKACGANNVVISLQGLVSVIARYYRVGLDDAAIIKNLTPYDILRRQSVFDLEKSFIRKGKSECDMISLVQHVIGRTCWDKVHALSINPKVNYHFCNETLREEFFEGKWEYDKCTPHSIFLSQASYPVKGLHLFLKALSIVRESYPDVKVRISGPDFIHPKTKKEKLKFGGYARLIRSIITENSLNEIITFTGPLSAIQMKQEYLNANVFVCPSTIENSPNSLGEAQLLGVPSVASYVGGVPDFIPNDDCGRLYRFEEFEMLAYHIRNYFEESPQFDNTTMRNYAKNRHDPERNQIRIIEIYNQVKL